MDHARDPDVPDAGVDESEAKTPGNRGAAGDRGGAPRGTSGDRPRRGAPRGEAVGGDTRLTEARNPRTRTIDRAETEELVRMIQREDREVLPAVEAEREHIVELVDRVVDRLRRGGRLFYVGAGTSGRLGVLDAAECPPTFGTDPELVQGLIAGGRESLVRSREGVEDDREAGRRDVRERGVGPDDFLLGIATSGTTPYVHAAVEEARERGAGTGFLCCTDPPASIREAAEVLVVPRVGPEVIAGSTRMKAGTATKLVLNTLSTSVMVHLGKVYENLMVDLQAVSVKLVDRGIRIVRALTGADEEAARARIREAGGSVKTALAMQELGAGRFMAERLLDAEGGRLRPVIDRYADGLPASEYAPYPEAPAGAEEAGRVVTRLKEGPERVAEAVGRAPRASTARPGWSPAAHVAHLLEFERDAVQPRLRGLAAGEERFADWRPSDPPPGVRRPVEASLEDLRRARAATVARIGSLGSPREALERRLAVGGSAVTLYQFLRGLAQHDDAHATRISERIHPALRTPSGSATPEPSTDGPAADTS